LVLVLACVAPAAASVADYLGKPVTSVRLVRDGRETTEPALVQLVETQVGRPLSMIEVRESITHLFSLGRFDDVRVDASMEGTGVGLRYELSPIHVVSKVEFTGALDRPGVDVGQLRRAVVDRYGTSPPLGRVAEMSLTVGDTLREHGYRHPDVEPRADIDHQSEQAVLVFTVDPGARTTIGTIEVVGTPTVPREEFLRRLGVATGAPYQPDDLDARIMRYVDTRRSRGYYEDRVTPAVTFEDNDRVANLKLSVDPGPHVRVVFSGDSLPSDKRDELVPIEREGSADEDLLEDSTNRIEEYLRGQGYRDAKAPHTRQDMNGELLITFALRRGPQYRVDRVEMSGNASMSLADLQLGLRTRVGEPFSDANLGADVTAIENRYRGRGFAAVKVHADPRPETSAAGAAQVPVAVSLLIAEGVRTVVGTVRIEGNDQVPEGSLRGALGLRPGAPYFDLQLRADRDAIQLQYANRGYQSATVDARPGFTPDGGQANPVFTVREGPRVFVDHVIIAGNIRTSAATIERELQLKPGDPLSLAAEYESQRRLAALQLFRRAPQITELRHGDETKRDLLVTVEEAAPTTLDYGGGLEGGLRVVTGANGLAAERFELAPRASVGLGRRNLFGTNQSVNLFASVSLYPSSSSSGSTVGSGFTEYRVQATFHEPRLANTAIDGLLAGTVEQQIRPSFNFARRSVTAQASRRLARKVSVSGAYQIEHTQLLDVQVVDPADQALIEQVFTQVLLSSFSVQGAYDTRDNPVDSTRGEYVSALGQLAARAIGSEVGFAKSVFTAQAFRTLPHSRGAVVAVQARLGLATAFPLAVVQTEGGQTVVETVRELPEPERFFAGGEIGPIRGFALDTVGTPATIAPDGFPIGGNAETIFNGELRVPVGRGVGVVGFVDTGNVFAQTVDIDLGALRWAAGVGLRYKSPVGPLRVDLGFNLDRQPNESLTAWFISFGQAF